MKPRIRKAERQQVILSELKLESHVRIAHLAERFGVSTETVRRDLDALSRQGLVTRSYGGAAAVPMGVQPPYGERSRAFIEQRARIGRLAAQLVQPGDVLMIDAGSTTSQFARALVLASVRLTVLTNSLPIATTLGQSDTIDVILCPGDLVAGEAAVYGDETDAFLTRYHADRAFIGAGGLTGAGIMDVNRAASAVKRRMLQQSAAGYLLLDHTKFDIRLLSLVAPLTSISALVSDAKPPPGLRTALDSAGVEVHIADAVATRS